MTAADLTIEMLAEDEAALREANRQLIDLVADLCYENACLRIARDAVTARLQRQLREQLQRLDEQRA